MSRVVVETNLAKNVKTLDYARSFFVAVAGTIAGILGLTGWSGFVFYLVTTVVFGFGLLAKMQFQTFEFFRNGLRDVMMEGVLGGALSYVLFWTLAYNVIYVYE